MASRNCLRHDRVFDMEFKDLIQITEKGNYEGSHLRLPTTLEWPASVWRAPNHFFFLGVSARLYVCVSIGKSLLNSLYHIYWACNMFRELSNLKSTARNGGRCGGFRLALSLKVLLKLSTSPRVNGNLVPYWSITNIPTDGRAPFSKTHLQTLPLAQWLYLCNRSLSGPSICKPSLKPQKKA